MISNRVEGTAGDVGGRGAAVQARSRDRRLVRQRAGLLLRQNQRLLRGGQLRRRRAAAVARASSRYATVFKTPFGVGSGVGPFYHSFLHSFLHPEWPLHAAVAFTKHYVRFSNLPTCRGCSSLREAFLRGFGDSHG
jgi:hypothetical protein